ncbi:MAG: TetR/AcrR family transcriptional regulator [Chthoniobacterales bacterium]
MFRLNDDNSTPGARSRQGIRRREEYAQATRQAIVDAARRLFSERGYFSTKVDDIAALARVAPATVYAVSGGKHGLLNALLEIWAAAPIIAATIGRIEAMDDPAAIIRLVSKFCRSKHEEFGDIMRVLLTTAPHDEAVSESLQAATAKYRQAFVPIAHRLLDLGALRDGMDAKETVDVFWFYFGYVGLFTLHDENGWSYERAERWLSEEASRALLQNHQTGSDRAGCQTTNRRGRLDH